MDEKKGYSDTSCIFNNFEKKIGLLGAKSPSGLRVINLIKVPHKEGYLITPYLNSAYENQFLISNHSRKQYYNSKKYPNVSFREANSSETISILDHYLSHCYIYGEANDYELGHVIKLSYILIEEEGVYVNIPRNSKGSLIDDKRIISSKLEKAQKVNGIFFCENGLGFAPFETFKIGEQDYETFARGGLARVLEQTKEGIAKKLFHFLSGDFSLSQINKMELEIIYEKGRDARVLAMYKSYKDPLCHLPYKSKKDGKIEISSYWIDNDFGSDLPEYFRGKKLLVSNNKKSSYIKFKE
jgi:hypothetical protein